MSESKYGYFRHKNGDVIRPTSSAERLEHIEAGCEEVWVSPYDVVVIKRADLPEVEEAVNGEVVTASKRATGVLKHPQTGRTALEVATEKMRDYAAIAAYLYENPPVDEPAVRELYSRMVGDEDHVEALVALERGARRAVRAGWRKP